MSMAEELARRELVEVSRRIHARGWVANHDGNLSVRLGEDRFLCTPTAVSKAEVSAEMLIVVNAAGEKVEGTRKSFSELALHLAVYRTRPDVLAVLHAHPPFCTAFACAGLSLDPPFLAEAVVSLGPTIPLCPFSLPFGEEGARPLADHLPLVDALLLANHGALTWGPDLTTAYLRLELVEHLARIKHTAAALGGVRPLDADVLDGLLDRRRKAGLGPEARGITPPWAPFASEGPSADPRSTPLVGPCSGPLPPIQDPRDPPPLDVGEVERRVRAEIARILQAGG